MALARRRLQLLHDRAHLGIAHSIEERSIECFVLDLGFDPRGTGLGQRSGSAYTVRPGVGRRLCTQPFELPQQRRNMAIFGIHNVDEGAYRPKSLDDLAVCCARPVLVFDRLGQRFDRCQLGPK